MVRNKNTPDKKQIFQSNFVFGDLLTLLGFACMEDKKRKY